MSEDKFWENAKANGDLIIESVFAIAVHKSHLGEIVIRQHDEIHEDEQAIILPVSYVPTLIAALQRVAATTEP